MLFISLSIFSQTTETSNTSLIPGDGISPFSLEVNIGQQFGNGNNLVTAPGVRVRYFLNQNMAIRAGLNLGSNKQQKDFSEEFDGSGKTGSYTTKYNNFNFSAGFEYHFASTKRLSPYVAIGLSFGSGKETEEGTNAYNSGFQDNSTYNKEVKRSSFGTGLNAGLDFYVAENLFVGVEFGYRIVWTTIKEGTYSFSDDFGSGEGVIPGGKITNSGIGAFTGLRLGWRF